MIVQQGKSFRYESPKIVFNGIGRFIVKNHAQDLLVQFGRGKADSTNHLKIGRIARRYLEFRSGAGLYPQKTGGCLGQEFARVEAHGRNLPQRIDVKKRAARTQRLAFKIHQVQIKRNLTFCRRDPDGKRTVQRAMVKKRGNGLGTTSETEECQR